MKNTGKKTEKPGREENDVIRLVPLFHHNCDPDFSPTFSAKFPSMAVSEPLLSGPVMAAAVADDGSSRPV